MREDDYLTVKQAARRRGQTPRKIYAAIRQNKLFAYTFGKQYAIPQSEIVKHLNEGQENEPTH